MAADVARGAGRVCIGRIRGPKGVKGEVRIESYTQRPEDVAAYGPVTDEQGSRRFTVRVTGRAKGMLVARLSGIEDRNQAEALQGMALYVERDALPRPGPGEYYEADLLGLAATTTDGAPFGKVVQVHDYGAGASLEIAPTGGGAPVLVPFTGAAVPEVDIDGGRIVIDPPEGLLETPERPADGAEKG